MHKLIEFIRSTYVFVLFVIFEAWAINHYAHATYYTQARLLTQSNRVVGGVHGMLSGIRSYFLLGNENKQLLEYVGRLTSELATYKERMEADSISSSYYKDTQTKEVYRVLHASVISNTINRQHNLIVLNCGQKEGVREGMTLLAPNGSLAGYVADCSDHYAVAISVLNTSMQFSGKLKHNDHLGSILWDGKNPEIVTMTELTKYAFPEKGNEVVTAGLELSFAGIKIGEIEDTQLNETGTQYKVRIRLSANMSSLTDVLLVERCDIDQIKQLKQSPKIQQYYKKD